MKQRVISFHYELKNQSGEVLDCSRETDPLTYVEGQQQIIPGLEEALMPLKLGDKKLITVPAAKAYGVYEDGLKMTLSIDKFPQDEKVEMGDQFRMKVPGGEPRIFTVVDVSKTHVTIDGNHPLAGQDLFFDVEITEAREATEADLEGEEDCCDHDHSHHQH